MSLLNAIELADAFIDVTYTCVGNATSEALLPNDRLEPTANWNSAWIRGLVRARLSVL